MSYDYGISFVLAVGSFLLSELAGVLLVYLYVSKHSHDYAAKVQHGYYYTTDNASPLSAGHYRFDNSASTGGDSKLSHYCNGNSGGSNGKASSSRDNRNGNGGSKSNGRYGNHGGHEGASLAGNGNGNENGSAGKRCHGNRNRSCDHSPSQSDAYGHAQTGGGCGSVSRDVSCYTSLSMGTRDSSHHTVSTLNDVSSDTVSTITMRNYDNHRLTTQV